MIKYDLIEKIAKTTPQKTALVDELKSVTWAEYQQVTKQLINALKMGPIDRTTKPVLFISNNSVDLVLVGTAFASLGIPFQGIDYHLSLQSIKGLINSLQVSCVFVAKAFEASFSSLSSACQLLQIEHFVESANADRVVPVKSAFHQAEGAFRSYALTSGTTGVPKIVCRTASFDKRRFDYLQNRYHFTSEDVYLSCFPLYHASSAGWIRLFLSLGCQVVMHNFSNGYLLCETLHLHPISATLMSPYMLKLFVSELGESKSIEYFPRLRFIMTGGKNCPINLKYEAINKLGPIVHEYFGTTETGVNTLLSSKEALAYPGSAGKVFEGNEIVIVDNNHNSVAAEQIGRMAIHSYMNMDNYLNSTAEFITLNHKKYLLTADYGYLTVQGYLFIVQRASAAKKKIFDFYAIENKILTLAFISDVSIQQSHEGEKINIAIVTSRYIPHARLDTMINSICNKYGVTNIMVNVRAHLDYTLTGKINLAATQIA
jgi:acyl-coenzyme A synthetase/AMP-(fatty) acid ligase